MIIQQSNFGTERIIRSGVHEGKYCYGDHIHQFCELVWVLDGEIEMTVHGKTEVAHRGEMTVITPFAVHSFNTKDYSKILIAVISDSFILGHVSRDELYTSRERSTFRLSEELSALLVAKDFIRLCTTQYQHRNDNYYLHTISSLVYMIFVEYFNTSPVVSTSATKLPFPQSSYI